VRTKSWGSSLGLSRKSEICCPKIVGFGEKFPVWSLSSFSKKSSKIAKAERGFSIKFCASEIQIVSSKSIPALGGEITVLSSSIDSKQPSSVSAIKVAVNVSILFWLYWSITAWIVPSSNSPSGIFPPKFSRNKSSTSSGIAFTNAGMLSLHNGASSTNSKSAPSKTVTSKFAEFSQLVPSLTV